ncbi:protein mono-ADP-ribosyltransferase PARP12-like isoform X1 [Salvelinus fontinalis]|uniref:protein mono-ADP-ribosyltransferase PARP12-like isoform X1 n=1 Tax=Salvelinus fontinalis TaxID=8038 RepID=UPI0024852F01|nr:protein mono-ADP-ribosyltransferase PARP12-like isoform X1 [Salvelinus fontinalis]
MSSVVSQYVTKIICGNQGCLDFKQLDQIVGQKFTCADEILLGILSDSGKYAISEGKEKASGCVMSHDSVIVAKTSLRVCQTSHKECHQCDNLHICSHFVCGNCKYGNKCKKAHSLDSPHNAAIISEVGHHDLGEAELFQLLLQNDPYLMPEICSHYNKRVGEHGICKFKSSCTKLHLCLHFLQGDCRFGAGCKRAHTFDAPAMKILNSRGFSQENIKILHNIYNNKFIITHQENPAAPSLAPVMKPVEKQQPSSSPTSETDRNEICLFSIRSRCSFKDTCIRVHYHLPYKWQILDGVAWRDLDNVEEIEKAYCNPQNETSGGSKPVNFLTMTCGSPPVRRLSTISSVTKPPYFILTTEWLWYWRDDCGQWIEYGHEVGEGNVASVISQTLEKAYQTDSDSEITFESGDQKYILNLKEMHQQNIRFTTKRAICRRPRFLSKEDVNAKLKSESKESSSSSVTVPPHWDKGVLSDATDYKLVPLSSQIEEYQKLEKLFKHTMASSTIHSIKRIQNPSLWRVFQWQKEQMMKKNGGKPVDERQLFHGTDHSIIDVICEQNFDWRTCGVNGTLYGLGSYFARDASYSDAYIRSQSNSKKIMFVALVLVGEFTNGCETYRRPPQKSTSKVLYDSCVNSENNPSIFVVFEKQQIYPEYLIEYSLNPQGSIPIFH